MTGKGNLRLKNEDNKKKSTIYNKLINFPPQQSESGQCANSNH